MLKKYAILERVNQEKIMGIVRVATLDAAAKTMAALYEGGVTVAELAFTMPYAHTILEALTKEYGDRMLIGAGTVLDEATARLAILSGAQFLVTPAVNADVVRVANRYGIPCFTGVNTPTELVSALECGVDVVKLFPASGFKPSVIKDLKAPFPNAEIMAVGGVSLENIKAWIDAGAFACGIGGELVAGAKTGDYAAVTAAARAFREIVSK